MPATQRFASSPLLRPDSISLPCSLPVLAIVALLAAALALPAPAAAQEPDSADMARIERAFAEFARLHDAELRDLHDARGVTYSARMSHGTLGEVMALLGDRLLLAYRTVEDDALEVFVLSYRSAAMGRSQVGMEELNRLQAQLRSAWGVDALQAVRAPRLRAYGLDADDDAAADPAAAAAASRDLSDALFPEPVRDFLRRELARTGRHGRARGLVIVPAGSIGTVPFAALEPFDDDRPLIEHAALAIAPSLFDIGRVVERSHGYGDPLVVGNPDLAGGGEPAPHDRETGHEADARLGDPDSRRPAAPPDLPPLPGAEQEAIAVAGMLGVEPLIGSAATARAVIEAAGGAPLIYLATHGLADPHEPLDGSFIALARDIDGAGEAATDYARWTAREIQHQRMAPYLVVLSACQTALGREHDAGVIGLARAFQLAGAAQVVVSLWSVDDEATRDLMFAFMRALRAQLDDDGPASLDGALDVPGALRSAMLETARQRPEPAAWAPFIVFGGIEPVAGTGEEVFGGR